MIGGINYQIHCTQIKIHLSSIWLSQLSKLGCGNESPISSKSRKPLQSWEPPDLSRPLSLDQGHIEIVLQLNDGSRVPLSFDCINSLKFSFDDSRVLPQSVFKDQSCINVIPSVVNMLNVFHFGFLFWTYNRIRSFMPPSILLLSLIHTDNNMSSLE